MSIEFHKVGLPASFGNYTPGFQPGAMDADGDGIQDLIVRKGSKLYVYTQGLMDTFILNDEDLGVPVMGDQQFTLLGFYDLLGDLKKEMVLAPGYTIDSTFYPGDLVLELHPDKTYQPSFYWTCMPCWGLVTRVANVDADAKDELITVTLAQGSGKPTELHVFGEGFTPGVTEDPGFPGFKDGFEPMGMNHFSLLQVMPANFRLPFNFSFFPNDDMQDLNGDETPDFGFIQEGAPLDSVITVISGKNQQILYSGPLPSVLGEENKQYSIGYHDFYGSGQKQIMVGASNNGYQLRDMESIVVIDPANEAVDASLLPFLEQDFRIVAISNWRDDSLLWVIAMEKLNTKRVILLSGTDGLQGGGTTGIHQPEGKDFRSGSDYILNKIWSSAWPSPNIPKRRYGWNFYELDPNNDLVPDLPFVLLADSTGSGLAEFRVFSGTNGQVIWDTDILPEDSLDLNPYFLGFFDVDGDGEKELYIDQQTVFTADGSAHKPFEPGFHVLFLTDLNGDGHEEVIGQSSDQHIQVYSREKTNLISDNADRTIHSPQVSPNPVNGPFQISWFQTIDGDLTLAISGVEGRTILKKIFKDLTAGQHKFTLDLPADLPGGWYVCQLSMTNGMTGIPFLLKP